MCTRQRFVFLLCITGANRKIILIFDGKALGLLEIVEILREHQESSRGQINNYSHNGSPKLEPGQK